MPKAVSESWCLGLHRSHPEIRQPGAHRSQGGTDTRQGRRSERPLQGRRTHPPTRSRERIYGRSGPGRGVLQFRRPCPAHLKNRSGRNWPYRVCRWRSIRPFRPGYPARRLAPFAFFPYLSARDRPSGSPGTDLQGVYHLARRTVSQVAVAAAGPATPWHALFRRPKQKSPENRFTRQPWRDDSATGIRLPGTSPVSGLFKCGPKCQDVQFRGNGGYPNPVTSENGRRGIGPGVPEEGFSQPPAC